MFNDGNPLNKEEIDTLKEHGVEYPWSVRQALNAIKKAKFEAYYNCLIALWKTSDEDEYYTWLRNYVMHLEDKINQ